MMQPQEGSNALPIIKLPIPTALFLLFVAGVVGFFIYATIMILTIDILPAGYQPAISHLVFGNPHS